MRMTERGKNICALLLLLTCFIWVLIAAEVGQDWKQHRLQQQEAGR